jgi:type IX secretion system PorP/SprF family membrane protein
MRRILLFVVVSLAVTSLKAQQDPQFTQWFQDKQSFNPAAVGLTDAHCLSVFYRNQWNGFDNQPNTAMVNYSGRIANFGGVGLTFYNDQLGQETNNIFRIMGGYHINAGGGTLSLGLGLGYYGKQLGNSWLPPDGVASIPSDAAINSDKRSDGSFDMNLGVYYYQPEKYYFGISSTHLTQSDLDQLSIKVARHYYLMGGYNFDINSDFVLRTNLLAKSDFNKSAIDVNANILWRGMLYGGLSYRPGDAVAPMVGLEYCTSSGDKSSQKNQCFRIGYSYDATTSEIKNFSSGSHEIFVGYCFKIVNIPSTQKHANPRIW